MTPEFWQKKRVFLTGHTGFKGSWLSLWLQMMGAEVHGFSLVPSSEPNLFTVARVAEGMSGNTIADIRNYANVRDAIIKCEPEIIIHMAAQPLVRHSYIEPVETYATNVMGTVHVLDIARQTSSVKAIVVISTDKCYENKEWLWGYREGDSFGGHDPYSNSKACAEMVTSTYRYSFFKNSGCAVATARAGNVIGGGDWATDRLVPDILRAFENNKPVIIRNPQSTRPWQHVLEPLSGYLTLAEMLYNEGQTFAEGWNFGPENEDARTVQWITECLAICWGNGASWQNDEGKHPYEAQYLKLDISKAKAKLDWYPQWSLKHSIGKTVEWHQAFIENLDMRAFTIEQILTYKS